VSRPLRFDPIAEAARQWDEHWGTSATPAMSAVTSIMRVQQILISRLNAVLEPHELTFPRYEALMLLYYSRRGALPLGKMSDRLQVHRTSVTNTVDRRTTLARITDRGRDVGEQATRELNEMRFGTSPLERRELDQLMETLRKVRVDAGDFEDALGASSRGG
jgi:DNA-binding MarR family transcriptional regulator